MIYLDNAATTKPSESALKQAEIYNKEMFFNPSALYHGGISLSNDIKSAKECILKILGTEKHEIIFCSCGSEADNTAIFSGARRGVFITTEGEHSAVYKTAMELKNRGVDVSFAKLNTDGSVNTENLFNLTEQLKPNLVSVVHVNNETGAINDINAISKKIKEISSKTLFHSDGVQAFCKIPFRLSQTIDMYSLSAHKIGGLKGVGALVKLKNSTLHPLIYGGGQENGMRSGTENVFGIKVFEFAAKERFLNLKENFDKISHLKELLIENLKPELFTAISDKFGSPYILLISAEGVRGEVVMHELEKEEIIVGNGSACSSKNRYSRIVSACGYNKNVLDGLIRISFSPDNTQEEILETAKKLNEKVAKLKKIMN